MNNLNLFATAKLNGGTYNNIRIFGSTEVNGDLSADKLSIYGSAKFISECNIIEIDIFGSSKFEALVKVRDLRVKGACSFNNDVNVENLTVHGAVNFNKKVFRAKKITIYGAVNVNVLESDIIIVKGALNCDEQLNADNIEISSSSKSVIKEMVGSKIVVKPEKKIFGKAKGKIETDTIEGDEIELENVVAKIVRGKNIKIGPNCKIDKVEYNETLTVSNNAVIGEKEKI